MITLSLDTVILVIYILGCIISFMCWLNELHEPQRYDPITAIIVAPWILLEYICIAIGSLTSWVGAATYVAYKINENLKSE